MAWVRTAASLISFGFTIYKFFQYLRENGAAERIFGPREFALVMITIGIAALVLAAIEHRFNMRQLRQQYGVLVPRSLALITACFIAGLGVIGLLVVFFRQSGSARSRLPRFTRCRTDAGIRPSHAHWKDDRARELASGSQGRAVNESCGRPTAGWCMCRRPSGTLLPGVAQVRPVACEVCV